MFSSETVPTYKAKHVISKCFHIIELEMCPWGMDAPAIAKFA